MASNFFLQTGHGNEYAGLVSNSESTYLTDSRELPKIIVHSQTRQHWSTPSASPAKDKALKQPQSRSTQSMAPAMRLPAGYTTDHWAWSMSDPSFRVSEDVTLPWEELDEAFLFPMASVKEATSLAEEPGEDTFFGQITSSDDDSESLRSDVQAAPSTCNRPAAVRSSSYAATKTSKHQVDPKRSNSIPVANIKAVRRSRRQQQAQRANDAYKHRKVSANLQLRRQVAELTQRLTMTMANMCTACRLGLIECGDLRPTEAAVTKEGIVAEHEVGERHDEAVIGGKLHKLTRQAEMLAF